MVPATSAHESGEVPARATFVWGLKRSGIHLVVNWLYANHGATVKHDLDHDGLHRQLFDGFRDPAAGVVFYNNCGRLHSRRFELGDLMPDDFDQAARRHTATIFGIEDCALRFASRTSGLAGSANVLIVRDPLNNLASRLEAAKTRPEQFRVDETYIDLVDAYCAELLGHTNHLPRKSSVSYNRFVEDRVYRDALAAELGLKNLDVISEVSEYGGGSSFSGSDKPSPSSSLMTRFHQHPVPPRILDMLLERRSVREACSTIFGCDLAELAGEA